MIKAVLALLGVFIEDGHIENIFLHPFLFVRQPFNAKVFNVIQGAGFAYMHKPLT